MSSKRLEITVSDELWGRLELARGHEPRASFVKRALESALRVPPLDSLGPSPSPALLKAAAEVSMRQGFREGALERVERSKPVPRVPGVETAAQLLSSRQARLNAERAKKK